MYFISLLKNISANPSSTHIGFWKQFHFHTKAYELNKSSYPGLSLQILYLDHWKNSILLISRAFQTNKSVMCISYGESLLEDTRVYLL